MSRYNGAMQSVNTKPDHNPQTRWGTPNTAGVSIPHELSFQNIGHRFGKARILDDVSLVAKTGSVTCLLGPSGSGKTTLLRIAAGMERQSEGAVLMDGQIICDKSVFMPPEKRGVGLVFQDYALFPHLNILDNVLFGLKHLKRPNRAKQAMQLLSRVGLDHRCKDFPHNLSGGEQQRVALARALAPRPGILLMDEPFSGLDSRLRDTMREETLAILRETHATSIIVTHDPEEALRMGDQIALLHKGKLEQAGTGKDLYFRPKSLFAAGFFSELNVFDGICDAGRIETPLGPIAVNGAPSGSKAIAAVRIGAVKVEKSTAKKAGAIGRILSSRFTGDHEYLRIGLNFGDNPVVRARIPAHSLSADMINGSQEVAVSASLEGSFAFTTG